MTKPAITEAMKEAGRAALGPDSGFYGYAHTVPLAAIYHAMHALAAATGTAKTPKAVECEASQSGPKGNAQ